ncbi:hypothetical protein RO575_14135 [Methylomonas sp. MO1]|uniref:hypothetical protein n=1 Tax=Methylomonas sp. MO1 TaxID=3073619 RepID=UPI0028A4B9DC|nr:hypothetical protein [Methylomonas sp. MO1]MDT4290699.1 hypothetical protein [Methylomonas sp. MO1]
MTLDAKGRIERAQNAARIAAKNRRAKTEQRDKEICRAYLYLSSGSMEKAEILKSIAFLIDQCGGPNLKKQETAFRKLEDGTKLTRQRIHQIVKKGQKPS